MTMPPSRWSVIAAFALVGAATQVLWLAYAPVTTVAAEHFGVDEAAIGWLAQVFPLLYVVLAIPAGIVLDRWFRSGLAAGAVLTFLGAAIRLVDDSYGWALAGQTLVAVAQPLVLNAITGIAGRYLAQKNRPLGIAIAAASTFAGMVIAFLLGVAFPAAEDLRTLVLVGAVFALVAAVVLVAALRRPGEHRPDAAPAGFHAFRAAWGSPFIRLLCALVFLPFAVFISLTTWAQALLEPAGVSVEAAGLILMANVVAGVIGSALLPVWAARMRKEVAVLLAALAVTAVACVLLAVAPGVAVGFVALTVIGFVLLPALPIVLELAERRAGAADGTAAGLIWMSGNLGGLVLATLIGFLVDQPALSFVLMGAVLLPVVPLIRSLRGHLAAPQPHAASDSLAPSSGSR